MTDSTPISTFFLNHRRTDTHKGDYGHALLVAGSYGKAGAAILAARACLRSGVGLLTVHVPRQLVSILQVAVPEAMVSIDKDESCFTTLPCNLERYDAVAMGPGLGALTATQQAVQAMLAAVQVPLVLDADALNSIAQLGLQDTIPPHSVLTPHDGEYRRLFGEDDTTAIATKHHLHIVRKGYHSRIFSADGICHVNNSGNPGMATAGSGDVLTGVILALLSQGMAPEQAASIGVYLHGRAGDIAVQQQSQASLTATDIIEALKKATITE